MSVPACGFMYEQGDPPEVLPCRRVAVTMALEPALGAHIPACADCAVGKQTQSPTPPGNL